MVLLSKEVELFPKQRKVLLTGDFNVEPGSAPYQVISKVLHDGALVAKQKLSNNSGTFNGFGREPTSPNPTIDFIFVSSNLQVQSFQVDNRSYNGLYPSDHEALVVVVELD